MNYESWTGKHWRDKRSASSGCIYHCNDQVNVTIKDEHTDRSRRNEPSQTK
jgi:hypothetical protein